MIFTWLERCTRTVWGRKDVAKAREYYNEYFEYCKSLAEMGITMPSTG